MQYNMVKILKAEALMGGQLFDLRAFLESGEMGILQESPPMGEKWMETGKMGYCTQKSMQRGNIDGKLGK